MKPKKIVFENTTTRKKHMKIKPLSKDDEAFISIFNEKSIKGTKDGMIFMITNDYDSGVETMYPLSITPVKTKMIPDAEIALDHCTTISADIPAKSKITLICTPKKLSPKPVLTPAISVYQNLIYKL